MFDRRATFWVLYLPPLFWLTLFFLVPLGLMVAFSFRADMQGEVWQWFTPSLKQYSSLFAGGSYWRLLGTSVVMALAGIALGKYIAVYFAVLREFGIELSAALETVSPLDPEMITGIIEAIKENLQPLDILFVVLAAVSAGSIGMGARGGRRR